VSSPTISVVVTAYNAEEYIGEALTAILSQTRPPDEVIVVDDGSTDGTPEELTRFGREIKVVRQANAGHAAALNRACREARGDYLAKCDADDVWVAHKLERQFDALQAHPEIDITLSAMQVFGTVQGSWPPAESAPQAGVQDRQEFTRALYRLNLVCSTSTLIRRELYERVGPFAENLPAEDYDYWFRALRAGAVFHFEPDELVRHRRHDRQVTDDVLRTWRAIHEVHRLHASLVDDRQLVRAVLAADLFKIGRLLVDGGHTAEARQAFRRSLRYTTGATSSASLRALVWTAALSAPAGARRHTGRALVGMSRAIDGIRGGRHPALP
jgi:glycosyltransferase involved in cell wall biosynthesis